MSLGSRALAVSSSDTENCGTDDSGSDVSGCDSLSGFCPEKHPASIIIAANSTKKRPAFFNGCFLPFVFLLLRPVGPKFPAPHFMNRDAGFLCSFFAPVATPFRRLFLLYDKKNLSESNPTASPIRPGGKDVFVCGREPKQLVLPLGTTYIAKRSCGVFMNPI